MGVSLSHGLDTGGVTHRATWLHAQLPYCHGILRFMGILIQAPLPQPPSRHAPWQPGLLCRRQCGTREGRAQRVQGPLCINYLTHSSAPDPSQIPHSSPTVLSIQDPYSNTLHRSPGAYLPSRSCILNPISPHSQSRSFRTQALSLLDWPFIPQLKCHSQRSLPSDSPLPGLSH